MYFQYEWVAQYLENAPTLDRMMDILNATGLETERKGDGLEIEHTINRPDAMSHYGVAREIAVKNGSPLREPKLFGGDIAALEGWTISSDDPAMCPQYMGLLVENVKAEPSPQWLVDRLTAIEQTSHNFLVDLTNFLLWEFGHPSHAFDADKLAGNQLRVRFAEKGETLTTLDGNDHKAEGYLCIADAERPVAFAGVMGGANSEVDENTTRLLLELAAFDPVQVRYTGRDKQIHSDARHRFERGIDRENMDRIIRRFLHLLLEQQPDARVIGLLDMNVAPFERKSLVLRRQRLDQLLGISLPDEQVMELLQRMAFRPEKIDQGWRVLPPGYKVDVTREVDVIEELIRFAGFDLLTSELPAMGGSSYRPQPLLVGERLCRGVLVGMGLQQAVSFSFAPEDAEALFAAGGEPMRVRNPMNIKQAVMRRNILPTLLACVATNAKRGLRRQQLFEIGHVFDGGREPHHLAMVLGFDRDRASWFEGDQQHPFYHIKGFVEALAERLGLALTFRSDVPAWLQQGEAVSIYLGERLIGGMGCVSSKIVKFYEFDQPLVVAELSLDFLADHDLPLPNVTELSDQPAMRQDMAFVVDRHHEVGAIQQHILGLNPEFLELLELFDVYEGKPLEKGKKSVGFRFHFRAKERTLVSEEVAKVMETVVESVRKTFGAVIRI
ncbi:phenylalanine--tRNA ligase subunit beta [Acanthopleuribacter pedis]|uniref:Phenylalanine--tRNA ligase beta subunit n=1 Tax=Acanthopleuribacter pedis TaxID=442870 RepID=A0A8J7QQE6_9BACT|nr:phenylalanine--tRNA ligase subunit beta [Acanthopleuribacter pedis]MBO1322255.1 phenylalanine--tRNA ligase subunit beta [Acanthopleuribacter pedis]